MELGPKQTQWVEALESGEYKQGKVYLCCGGEYCCLGVANELFNLGCGDHFISLSGSGHMIGLLTDLGLIRDHEEYSSLAAMNDLGVPFVEIAKFIRENPEKVFSKSV